MMVWRMGFTPDITFLQMALPTLLTGPAMVMFFVPVTGLAMASVGPDEQANAAGLSNFMRTLAGAFATSLVQTGWSNAQRAQPDGARRRLHLGQAHLDAMHTLPGVRGETVSDACSATWSRDRASCWPHSTCSARSRSAFFFAATLIWLAPKPKGPIDTSGAH